MAGNFSQNTTTMLGNGAPVERPSKLQSAFHKPYFFSCLVYKPVKADGIRSCRQQHDHLCIFPPALHIALFYPFGHFPAVGWVAEHHMPAPVLPQSIHFRSKVQCAFGIFRQGTGIQRKTELIVQPVEECLRSCPIFILR